MVENAWTSEIEILRAVANAAAKITPRLNTQAQREAALELRRALADLRNLEAG
jgi:hypothetical protein